MNKSGEVEDIRDVDFPEEIREASEDRWEISDEIDTRYNEFLQEDRAQSYEYKSAEVRETEREADLRNCPIEGNGGHWEGERGESKWSPERNEIPSKYNPDNKTWGEIMDKHGIDGVEFHRGDPDFNEITRDKVEIDDFSDDRSDNFDQADEALAKIWGCKDVDEVARWRKENKFTWHECRDCVTMQLVPSEVHNNISHRGGVSRAKEGVL